MMATATMHRPVEAAPAKHRPGSQVQVWAAFGALIIVPAVCIAGGQAGVLRLAFPALSVAAGAFLLWRSKPAYVSLVLWLWFVTPFLSRMADYQSGWQQQSAVELAPYAVAGLAGLPLLASLRTLGDRRAMPFVCALVAILYGFILGLATLPLFNVMRAMLNWLVPVLFGLFIFQHRDLYPEFKKVMQRSFLYGTLVCGAYAIYQFFTLPEWDRMWMLNVQLNSFGAVEAMKIRVFSTMNAPAIYAAVTTCGLLLLFNQNGKIRLLASACGFLGLVLTVSRSAWLSLAAGGVYLMLRAGMRQRVRLAVAIFACGVFLMGMTQVPVVQELLVQRMQSFSDPNQDVSFAARLLGHQQAFQQLSQEPFGEGMGSTDTMHNTEGDDDIIGPHDSTILEFLYSLGWIGTLVYGLGIGALVFQLVRIKDTDPFVISSKAILIGFIVQCFLNSVMIGILGFMVWTFAAMNIAAVDWASAQVEEPAAEPLKRRSVIIAAA